MELSRRDQLLKYIVELFIKTAQPVGSVNLIETYRLTYSSATIRNEMLALENDGLLEKTHTSSGRIPSSKGYRYYVDHLRNRNVDESFKFQLQTILSQKMQSVNEIIQKSSEILANMTNLASVVLGPNAHQEKLISIQIIPLQNNSATAVFITDSGFVENKTFVLPDSINQQSLAECVVMVNSRLKGTPVSQLMEKMDAIKPILEDYIQETDVIYQAFFQAFINFASERLKLYGQADLLNQPEFAHDADKLRHLLKLLESPGLFQDVKRLKGAMNIQIGDGASEAKDVSIISSRVKMPGQKEGQIAVLGPTRMDYDRVLSALEYVTEMLEKYFQTIERKDDNV